MHRRVLFIATLALTAIMLFSQFNYTAFAQSPIEFSGTVTNGEASTPGELDQR